MKCCDKFSLEIMVRSSLIAVVTMLTIVTGGPGYAADVAPQFGQQAGHIDAVSSNKNTVVIDDKLYHVSTDIRAHSVSGGKPILRSGYDVEFNSTPNNDVNSAGTITEIWILGRKSGR